jgi:alanyl-tRNA synthetase
LDDVGKDTYHHTFFEMLGNWSFGNYFKREAIDWAWQLLTEVYGLPPDRLYATYFEGSVKDNLPMDEEARDMWLEKLPADHVIPGNAKDNFWEMGATGPCGPCSEIHFDRIGGRNAAHIVNGDDPDVIEIWNNVFMQFNREVDGSLTPLPAKHVDTGMGLERIVSILQNKRSNYDTDIFMPIFDEIHRLTGVRAYQGKLGDADEGQIDMAYRVVADHIRTLSFAIADGQAPGTNGAGYILRRVLRRAVRYAVQKFNAKEGFFASLVDVVCRVMGEAFPDLPPKKELILSVILSEERSFNRTLNRGIERFKNNTAGLPRGATLDGKLVWQLYATYGFPVDLTELMAQESGLIVDRKGFEERLTEDTNTNRSLEALRKQGNRKLIELEVHQLAELHKKFKPTDDKAKFDPLPLEAEVLAIFNGAAFVESHSGSERVGLVLNATNFYAEQGGQVGDTGVASGPDVEFAVDDAQIRGGFCLHLGELAKGQIKVGDKLVLTVDNERRDPIMRNHTSTHLVNHSMRAALGPGIDQKGSSVNDQAFTFDFNFSKPLTWEQLRTIDEGVDKSIHAHHRLYTLEVPLDRAKEIHGIRAVFGETYPDPVRVVSIGVPVEELLADPKNPRWFDHSIEFCGGTHLGNSSEAIAFTITKEQATAAGIRRIAAVTGHTALAAQQAGEVVLIELEALKKLTGEAQATAVVKLLQKIVDTELPGWVAVKARFELQELQAASKRASANDKAAVKKAALAWAEEQKPGFSLVSGIPGVGADNAALGEAAKAITGKTETAVALFGSDEKGFAFAISIAKALPIDAGEWATAIRNASGGKGGGKGQTAAGSGPTDKLNEAIEAAKAYIASKQ